MYVSAGAQLGLRIGALGAAGVGGAVATYAVDRAAGPDGSGVSAPVRNAVHAAPVLLGVGGLASIGLALRATRT